MTESQIINNFVNYVFDFYGKGGIYDFGATRKEIREALTIRLIKVTDTPFDGDSVDREMVRDILLEMKNVEFPEAPLSI